MAPPRTLTPPRDLELPLHLWVPSSRGSSRTRAARARSLIIQPSNQLGVPDDKIVAVGYSGADPPLNRVAALVRYLPDWQSGS